MKGLVVAGRVVAGLRWLTTLALLLVVAGKAQLVPIPVATLKAVWLAGWLVIVLMLELVGGRLNHLVVARLTTERDYWKGWLNSPQASAQIDRMMDAIIKGDKVARLLDEKVKSRIGLALYQLSDPRQEGSDEL